MYLDINSVASFFFNFLFDAFFSVFLISEGFCDGFGLERWIDDKTKWIDKIMDRWKNGYMEEWIDGRMDRWKNE